MDKRRSNQLGYAPGSCEKTVGACRFEDEYEMSERQVCKLVDLNRSSYRYGPRPDHNAELRQKLVELARQKVRYGYRRLHAMLSRRGSPASA